MDAPDLAVPPLLLHTFSRWGPAALISSYANAAITPASVNFPTANNVYFVPMAIPFRYHVRRVFWVNGSSAPSHAGFGIYTVDGGQIFSTGSVAGSGTSAPQYVTPSTPFLLTPGRYLFAHWTDGTTNKVWGTTSPALIALRMAGMLQDSTSGVLANPAVFSAMASSIMVLCGVTRTDSGF